MIGSTTKRTTAIGLAILMLAVAVPITLGSAAAEDPVTAQACDTPITFHNKDLIAGGAYTRSITLHELDGVDSSTTEGIDAFTLDLGCEVHDVEYEVTMDDDILPQELDGEPTYDLGVRFYDPFKDPIGEDMHPHDDPATWGDISGTLPLSDEGQGTQYLVIFAPHCVPASHPLTDCAQFDVTIFF